jgi:hypothetical protein
MTFDLKYATQARDVDEKPILKAPLSVLENSPW